MFIDDASPGVPLASAKDECPGGLLAALNRSGVDGGGPTWASSLRGKEGLMTGSDWSEAVRPS